MRSTLAAAETASSHERRRTRPRAGPAPARSGQPPPSPPWPPRRAAPPRHRHGGPSAPHSHRPCRPGRARPPPSTGSPAHRRTQRSRPCRPRRSPRPTAHAGSRGAPAPDYSPARHAFSIANPPPSDGAKGTGPGPVRSATHRQRKSRLARGGQRANDSGCMTAILADQHRRQVRAPAAAQCGSRPGGLLAPGEGLVSPGGPGESHPRAPTERSVTVSRHSARLIPDLVRIRSSRPSGRTCVAAVRSAHATTSGLS
jgi:hypothetical protein